LLRDVERLKFPSAKSDYVNSASKAIRAADPEDPVMVRRVALLACVFLGMVVCGCSTWSDYQAGQAGQFQSQNL